MVSLKPYVLYVQKVAGAKETEAALVDERGKIGAPWGSVEEIEDALEDPQKEQVL